MLHSLIQYEIYTASFSKRFTQFTYMYMCGMHAFLTWGAATGYSSLLSVIPSQLTSTQQVISYASVHMRKLGIQ